MKKKLLLAFAVAPLLVLAACGGDCVSCNWCSKGSGGACGTKSVQKKKNGQKDKMKNSSNKSKKAKY